MSFLRLTGFRNDDQVFGPPQGFEARDWQDLFGEKFMVKMGLHQSQSPHNKPLVFSLEAGVGAGKTTGVAWVSSHVLNAKLANRIVYVAPNRTILLDAIDDFAAFGIDLVDWENGKYPHGEPAMNHGLAMTYSSLNRNPDLQRKLCRHIPTLLLLDEFHHLGDRFAWNGAAKDAFGDHVKAVITFSGTPWRADKRELPYVTPSRVEDNVVVYSADFSYPLGKCIADKVCRNPVFEFFGAKVEIPYHGGVRTFDFDKELNSKHSNLRLSGAVRHGTPSRTEMLARSTSHVEENRTKHKAIFFLGGNTRSEESARHDAMVHLPRQLIEQFKIDRDRIVVATGDDPKSVKRIREFNDSDANYLITIDMVSEGINIPRLDTAVFLSSVTAKLKTIQRVGRVLRGQGHAHIFMFGDSRHRQVAMEIEDEVKYYEALRLSSGSDEDRQIIQKGSRTRVPGSGPRGLSAWIESISVHGRSHSHQERENVRAILENAGLVADDDRICTTLELIDKGLFNLNGVV